MILECAIRSRLNILISDVQYDNQVSLILFRWNWHCRKFTRIVFRVSYARARTVSPIGKSSERNELQTAVLCVVDILFSFKEIALFEPLSWYSITEASPVGFYPAELESPARIPPRMRTGVVTAYTAPHNFYFLFTSEACVQHLPKWVLWNMSVSCSRKISVPQLANNDSLSHVSRLLEKITS